jgi:hypothetical protein
MNKKKWGKSLNSMSIDEIKQRIAKDPDFINLKRFDYSLKKLLERYPEGAPVNVISQALMIPEEDLEVLYENILVKLRKVIK